MFEEEVPDGKSGCVFEGCIEHSGIVMGCVEEFFDTRKELGQVKVDLTVNVPVGCGCGEAKDFQ